MYETFEINTPHYTAMCIILISKSMKLTTRLSFDVLLYAFIFFIIYKKNGFRIKLNNNNIFINK